MSETAEKIKKKVTPIMKAAGVTRSSIFGSVARGDSEKDSDVDFLIEIPDNKSLFEIIDLKLRLQDVLNRKVDLIEYDAIKPELEDYILKEQIRIL